MKTGLVWLLIANVQVSNIAVQVHPPGRPLGVYESRSDCIRHRNAERARWAGFSAGGISLRSIECEPAPLKR